ncbi:MAG: chemotaxis response regulator protein-glutamate methylesterase [Acidobacteriia bacterium]|nr:chemotaxis response regulator protein-glutamate methylesterase [Terriglobia bacterium]MBZ5656469.1 chemotaxis response regulator protein-glutamate methylesterase [Terriglobia bacterium]
MKKPIRVLVIDDSALMRKLIPQILERADSIEVVGTAIDGQFGLRKIEELAPQVVTLDLEMPGLNGIDTLKQIMRRWQLPVVVVSSHSTAGASITLKALALGAVDFVAKPHDVSARMPEIADELISKIRAAAQSRRVSVQYLPDADPPPAPDKQGPAAPTQIVAIGVSTGGPNALQYVFSQLPAEFSGSIVVVQHMPEGFTELFSRRLDETCPLRVKEAQSGDLLLAGRVLICPGNRHMKVKRMPLGNVAVLAEDAPVNGHRPSVDVLFRSVAEEFGPQSIGVLMTGMGEDGASGLGMIRAAGGLTIAQDRETCVVYGMPRAAVERGHAMRVVSLHDLPATLQAQCALERTRDTEGRRSTSAGSN